MNGSLRFLSCLALQHIDRTWLGFNYQTLSTWYVLSCATDGGSKQFLMCLLNTVVLTSLDARINSRCDSDASLSDTFYFFP